MGILVWSLYSITMNDILTKNQTIGSHLCDNRMWETIFKKRKKNKKNQVRFDPLLKLGSQGLITIKN